MFAELIFCKTNLDFVPTVKRLFHKFSLALDLKENAAKFAYI